MPRDVARIFLRVTDVRVERIQDISEADCIAEGIKEEDAYYNKMFRNTDSSEFARAMYAKLWDSLNAKRGYGWDMNPWVWVYTFERCEKPGEAT